MTNLIDIQSQIEKLQKQAADIKSKEFSSTVQDIVAKMRAFGITVKDIQQSMSAPRKGRGRTVAGKTKTPKAGGAKKSTKGTSAPIKYRGPNGETWSGRGLSPKWLAALVAQGRTKEDFAV